jgi:putative transcriptional regulator
MGTNRIKELRNRKRWTQREMAEKLHISVDYVSMLERGIRTPGFVLAKKIADLFNCRIEDIFFNNEYYKTSDHAHDMNEGDTDEAAL